MSEKKHIDRLFQEKFKDFEVAPPDELWGKIEAELQPEKKKRRVIPIWFRLGGVAAALIISMLLTLPLFTGGDKDGNGIDTNTNKVVLDGAKQNKQDKNGNSIVPATDAENAVVTTSDAPDNTALNQNGQNGFDSQNDTAAEQQGGNVSNTTNNNNSLINTDSPVITNRNNSRNNAVAYDNNTVNKAGNKTNQTSNADNIGNDTNRNTIITENGMPATQQDANRAVAQQNNNSKTSGNDNGGVSPSNQERDNSNLTDTNGIITKGDDTGIAANKQEQNQQRTKGAVSGNDANGNTVDQENNLINTQQGEGLLNDQINAQNSELANATDETDTTTVAAETENELDKILREQQEGKDEDEAVADAVKNYKWNVKPQVAPLFYSSMSQGSPIDAQFASNSKNYDADMSYGVGIDYAITDRLSVRSGINTVNLSYATNDVAYYASMDGGTNNIIAAGRAANIVVQSQNVVPNNGDVQGVIASGPGGGTAITFASNIFSNQSFEGQMVQKMGYIEVPLEMSYKLLKSKFGINLIGGFSTLFLNDNNVSVISNQGYSTEVGEASNVNSVNFSTNLGVGFKYNFWNSFEASFEPTFKYQVNTFSGSSGNFKPYFIGLYSGISFKF